LGLTFDSSFEVSLVVTVDSFDVAVSLEEGTTTFTSSSLVTGSLGDTSIFTSATTSTIYEPMLYATTYPC